MRKVLFFALIIGCCSFFLTQEYAVSKINDGLKKDANGIIRLEDAVISINKISDIDYKIHTVKTVFTKDFVEFAMPYISYSKGDKISNIKVTIYDEEGKKINSFSKSDFKDYANNRQGTFYSDSRVLVLNYTPIQFPYTVDFTYEYETDDTVFISDYTPFSNYNISLEESRLQIVNNSGINFRTKIYPSDFNYTSVIHNESGTTQNYSFKNVPAISRETLAPDVSKILPKVSFALEKFNLKGNEGSISSWQDFGKWYYNQLLKPVSVSNAEIKNEIASLHLQGTTEEKVKKIYQYMQSKTRYIFVALGIGGWQPMMPEEVQRKGYGDCKGLSNYMKTLLDEAGIESYYAIINSNPSEISFDKDFPKMGGNHVILMVPTENGTIWLENTSQKIAFNHLGFTTTNRNVLSVKPDGIEIVNTPVYSASQNKEEQTLNVQLHPDKSISGKGEMVYSGSQYDFNLSLLNKDAKERESYIRDSFDTLNFENLKISNPNNNRDDAKLSYEMEFKAANYSKNLGNSMLFRSVPIFIRGGLKTNENRQLPFEINYAYQDEYEINYTFPPGYEVDEMPNSYLLNSDYGTYMLTFTKKENGVQVKRLLKINKGLFPKDQYNAYADFRNKIMNADNSKILITKP